LGMSNLHVQHLVSFNEDIERLREFGMLLDALYLSIKREHDMNKRGAVTTLMLGVEMEDWPSHHQCCQSQAT
jgi:hypothetical protein